MTFTSKEASLSVKIKKPLRKGLGVCYMCVFLLILFFKNSDATYVWVTRGLELCARKLIPSLFPFMALSSLIVISGAGERIFKIFERPVCRMFGIGKSCCTPIILGWLCGFPVGAKCASELLSSSSVTLEEYKRILCISSTPSPAFLIGAVGSGMLGNTTLGVLIYVASVLSCIAIGGFINLVSGRTHSSETSEATSRTNTFAVCITRSVTESSVSMLYVCGFVIFFSAFLGAMEGVLSFVDLSETCNAMIFCFFEMTSGLSHLCSLSSPSVPLIAAAAGWSGLSVHFQTAAMCSAEKRGFGAYLLSHTAKAVLCGVLGLIIQFFI